MVVWVEGNPFFRKLTNDLHCHYAVTRKKLSESKNALETLNELLGLVLRTPVVLMRH